MDPNSSKGREGDQIKETFHKDQTEGAKQNGQVSKPAPGSKHELSGLFSHRLVFVGPASPSHPVSFGHHQPLGERQWPVAEISLQVGTKYCPQR